jgi:hypothetical protein
VITGCGGGSSDNDTPSTPPPEPPAPTTYTITGYAEDDPLVNATITINKENGEKLLDVTTDANGMYTLSAAVEKDQKYIIEAVGELSGKTVTMHSQFVFYGGNDTQVNINPLTELKYHLAQDNDQTLAQAEVLVRDYFNIVKGESLETIRFSTTDKAYIGLRDIAEIYGASLPIEAIYKVKEDIVRNDLSSTNQVKDYSYKNLVEQSIKLNVSATSLALNDELTVTIQGIETLNENYTLIWSGLPEEGVTGTDVFKTFTTSEYAQDLYISVSLYKKIGEQKTYVASASESINFYKPLEEVSALVEDSTIDNDYVISDALQMKVPANTLADGVEIKVTELQTNSETILAQFAIDSNAASTDKVIVEYNYDPYQVSEPRNLQVTLQGDEPKVIKVNEIDYANHVVKFEVLLNSEISRDAHYVKVIIELVKKEPSADQISHLYTQYMSYIELLLKDEADTDGISEALIINIKRASGKLKFTELMKRKERQTGEYYFNILAATINYIIAEHHAELMFNSAVTWRGAKESFYRKKNSQCVPNSYNGLPGECTTLEARYIAKIKEADQVLSAWVGKAKLTPAQANFIKIAKIITSQSRLIKSVSNHIAEGAVVTAGDLAQFYIGLTVTEANDIISTYNIANGTTKWTPNEAQGYAISAVTDGFSTVLDGTSKFNFAAVAVDFGINRAFDVLEQLMVYGNTLATAPLIFALSEDYNLLTFENSDKSAAIGFTKDEFVNNYFPSSVTDAALIYRNNILDAPEEYPYLDSDESRLSSDLDPNQRFDKAFLIGDGLSPEGRGFLFTAFRYMYGDQDARSRFKDFSEKSKVLAKNILFSVNEIPNSSITEEVDACDAIIIKFSIQWVLCSRGENKKTIIKSKLRSGTVQDLKNVYFNISNAASELSLKNIRNISTFTSLIEKLIIKLSNSQLESLNIKEIKVETYGVGLEFSTEDNAWILDESDKVNYTFKASDNINEQFVFNSETNKNELSFAKLFEGEDFAQFDNKLVGFKILLTYEKSGVDKVRTAGFVFTTLADNENLTDTNFSGATLKSSVKDAVTGDPLAGAFVTLNPGGLSSFTDENGDYEVSSLAAGEYTIIITKEGYKQVEASLTLTEDETKIYEISLSIDNDSATTSGTTNVTIKDAYNGSVLTNGYISLREGQNNKTGTITQTINSDGDTSIDLTLFPGHYTIEAGANGYAKSYSTVTIVGDVNVNKEVSISPVLADDQLRAVLTWGQFPSDLDSHLVKKINGVESYHVYYGNQAPTNADASLDTDDTSSYGPETVTINNIDPNAIYTYYVYNFSGGEDGVLPDSGAKIDIYSGDSAQTLYTPNEGGQYWKVFEIVNGEIVPCTENCVRDTDDGIARSINSEALIFKGLPPK